MIKPIETRYDGYRFRSRLEARWAVFFNSLGIDYQYEPEGFELPNGRRYLPDFKVKCWGCRGAIYDKPFDLYIEVKGDMTYDDAIRIKSFVGEQKRIFDDNGEWVGGYIDVGFPVLIVGNIPNIEESYQLSESSIFHCYDSMNDIAIYPFNYETIDGDFFGAYPAVRGNKFYLWGDDSNYIDGSAEDSYRMVKAYQKAREARFEYGEGA